MARSRKSFPRILAATFTTAMVAIICMLALAPAASARVTIVPGSVRGGGTETFAVRLSNEQPDLVTTRLELTFPTDLVVPLAEVAPVGKWDVTITMRRVDPPVTVDGREIDEAVASIVWTGGEVAPKQFEQFLVTAGPLPADGRLVLAAAQGYEDGTVDEWTDPAVPGWPGAPTIELVPRAGTAPSGPSASSAAGPVDSARPAAAAVDAEPIAEGSGVVPWVLLAGGVLVAGVGSVIAYRVQDQRARAARRRRMVRTAIQKRPIEKVPTEAGRR
jgi:uncharacterized protein YcnI